MADHFMQTMLSDDVLDAQQTYYGRSNDPPQAKGIDLLRDQEIQFITTRDSFYMATVSPDGWPYIQHRGGAMGFLRSLGENRIGFADYGGNRQLLSVGAVAREDRVSLFLMDYPNRSRLKILGHAQILDARQHPGLVARLEPKAGHGGRVERLFLIDVIGYDWNCPQHITPRFTSAQVEAAIRPLKERISELEALHQDRSE